MPSFPLPGQAVSSLVRVVILIQTRFYCDGLTNALALSDSLRVVGNGTRCQEALPLIHRERPDVVLLDLAITMRRDAVRAIAIAAPGARVIALSVVDAVDDVVPLAEAGVSGYVTRDQSLGELVGVIESVARGEMPCSPRVASRLLQQVATLAASRSTGVGEARLTARELEIVELIGCGLTNRQIGAQLFIEISTVKNHIHNILDKLQVSSRSEAVSCVRAPPVLTHAGGV